jgi:hypothetical protein
MVILRKLHLLNFSFIFIIMIAVPCTKVFSSSHSVADPCHFGVDPDPRIHASEALTNGVGSGSCYFCH